MTCAVLFNAPAVANQKGDSARRDFTAPSTNDQPRRLGPDTISASPPEPSSVFYSSYSTASVYSVDSEGNNPQTLATSQPSALGVAIDHLNQKVYWASQGTVRRCNLDGTGIEDAFTIASGSIMGLAIDSPAQKIYWTKPGAGTIERSNLDGSNPEVVATSQLGPPVGIDLDLLNGKIYWAEDGGFANGPTRIARANLDGSAAETVYSLPAGRVYGIAVDPSAEQVYWTNTSIGLGTVRRVDFDGSNDTELASGSGLGDVAIEGDHLFWAEEVGQVVRRAGLDGSNPVTIASGGSFWGVAASVAQPPEGVALYDAPPDFPGNPSFSAWTSDTSETGDGYQVYDSFMLTEPSQVTEVRWQGFYYDFLVPANNPPASDTVSWEIRFRSDNSGQPGGLLDSLVIDQGDVTSTLAGSTPFGAVTVDVLNLSAVLPRTVSLPGGLPIWISILSRSSSFNPIFSWTSGTGDNGAITQDEMPCRIRTGQEDDRTFTLIGTIGAGRLQPSPRENNITGTGSFELIFGDGFECGSTGPWEPQFK